MTEKILVVIESPFAGDIDKNITYARACMRDSLLRGEYPLASHLLYTQEGILDDHNSKERQLGIEAGLIWGKLANKTIVYNDLGVTEGMKMGINRAKKEGRQIEYRSIKHDKKHQYDIG
jgi:hypothetical protein